MGGQQGTRKTAPTPRPQTGRRIVEPPRNQPPQSSSTPPPVQQPTPVESFISGMGNIADPFFPQAQAQQDIFSTPKPIAKTARHPGSKNIRGAKNQAKIAKAKIALQLAKQKHQQQQIIMKQGRDRHDDQLARVEQMYGKDTANAMTGYFEANQDHVGVFPPEASRSTFFEQGIDGLAQGISEVARAERPKQDKLKGGYQKKGFQGTRKGDLQKRHTPEFQHPMMNPVPKLKGRGDPYFHSADPKASASTIAGLPHEIKRQMKNVQISQSGRKTTIGAAGDNYDNTFFEDIRGIPSTFMMYRGTNHERKGTIKEWEKLTPAQQQAEKDWETKSGGTSPVSTDNWTNPWG